MTTENKREPYLPFIVCGDLERVMNYYYIHMYLFYNRTQKMRLTQRDMAMVAGLSTSTIARIEAGKEANLSNILKYAHACGLRLELVPIEANPNASK